MAERLAVVYARRAGTVAHLLVRNNGAAEPALSGWEPHPVGLEELVLAYLREPGAAALRTIEDTKLVLVAAVVTVAAGATSLSLRPVAPFGDAAMPQVKPFGADVFTKS